ncbi:unnamed protein product, partial [Rotaria sordida]
MRQGAYCNCQEIILINNNNDIFRVLHSSLAPFISPSTSIGPEDEIEPKEIFSFKINFIPKKPGIYKTRIPFYINHHQQIPYTYIELTGELIMLSLIFEPR